MRDACAGNPDGRTADWIVLRNRLSMTNSRNKRQVDTALQGLSAALGFRYVDGLAERVIYRELFLRGLTALDELDETTLGARPTMSHVTARQEIEQLLEALKLDRRPGLAVQPGEAARDAA
jgi:chromosome partitioning protein